MQITKADYLVDKVTRMLRKDEPIPVDLQGDLHREGLSLALIEDALGLRDSWCACPRIQYDW